MFYRFLSAINRVYNIVWRKNSRSSGLCLLLQLIFICLLLNPKRKHPSIKQAFTGALLYFYEKRKEDKLKKYIKTKTQIIKQCYNRDRIALKPRSSYSLIEFRRRNRCLLDQVCAIYRKLQTSIRYHRVNYSIGFLDTNRSFFSAN